MSPFPSPWMIPSGFCRETGPLRPSGAAERLEKGVVSWSVTLTLGVEVRLLRGIQAIVVRNDVSRFKLTYRFFYSSNLPVRSSQRALVFSLTTARFVDCLGQMQLGVEPTDSEY